MDQVKIDGILADLYELDPGLKKEESRLRMAIEQLVAAKPDIAVDEKFLDELRARLMTENLVSESKSKPGWMVKLSYLASGVALSFVIIAPLVYWAASRNISGVGMMIQADNQSFSSHKLIEIKKVASNAFGQLNKGLQNTAQNGAVGMGGGGQESAKTLSSTAQASPMVASGATDAKVASRAIGIMPPVMSTYKFVYSGDGFELPEGQVEVLKRVRKISLGSLDSVKNQVGLGVIDLGRFENLNVMNLTAGEDREYGYMIYVNSDDGSISVSQNWDKWQNTAMSKCRDDKCYESLRLKIEDIPADADVIVLADTFMNDKNVNRENLGQPEVDNRWRQDYDRSEDKANYYIPDSLSVLYPYVINGQTVLDEWGNKIGISVNVDIRERRVTGLWGLAPQKYEGSDYDAQTDRDKVMATLERGGMYQAYYYGSSENKTIEVEVGEPEKVSMRIYRYDNNQTDELVVPALSFPVKQAPKEGWFTQKSIVVPLVKDLYDMDNGGSPILMREDTKAIAVPAATEPAVQTDDSAGSAAIGSVK